MLFAKNNSRFLIFLLLLTIAVFAAFYVPSIFKWWFEDDTIQFHYVSQITNPLNIFTDLATMREFSKALVPLQMLSYWLDVKLFGLSPLAAYLHSLTALGLTSFILFAVIKKLTDSKTVAAATLLVWLLLPSTLVVVQFLATRHYLEGLFFALLATYCLLHIERKDKISPLNFLTIIAAGVAAMLCKEIYAPLIVVLLTVFGIRLRKYALVFAAVCLTLSYGLYRIWVLGTDVTYTMPFLGFSDYLKYLAIFPYTLAAGKFSYLFYAAVIAASILLIKRQTEAWKGTAFLGALTASALLALYPVAFAVLINYKTPGTWYRVPFIINTLIVVWGIYTFSRVLDRKKFGFAVLITALIILPGTWQTRKYWNERMARAESEGKFYLENPDKLLLSEEDAPWFIEGVHRMSQATEAHYLNKQNLSGEQAQNALSKYPTIWRYQNGSFTSDEQTYCEIAKQNNLSSKSDVCKDK